MHGRRLTLYALGAVRIVFDTYALFCIVENFIVSSPEQTRTSAVNDVRILDRYALEYLLFFYLTPVYLACALAAQKGLGALPGIIFQLAALGPDTVAFQLACAAGFHHGFRLLLLWLGLGCLAEKIKDIHHRTNFLLNALRYPNTYVTQQLKDEIMSWYLSTLLRMVQLTLIFRPLLEIPCNALFFCAHVYSVTLVPQLLYQILSSSTHEAGSFQWWSLPVFLLALWPSGDTFHMPLTQAELFWFYVKVDVAMLRLALYNNYNSHWAHTTLILVYGFEAWFICLWEVFTRISLISMVLNADHARAGVGMGPGQQLQGDRIGPAAMGRAWLNDVLLMNIDWRELSRGQLAAHYDSVQTILRRLTTEVERMCERLVQLGDDSGELPAAEKDCIGCVEKRPELQFVPCCHTLFCDDCYHRWRSGGGPQAMKCPMCSMPVVDALYRRSYTRPYLSHEEYVRQGTDMTARELAKLYVYVHKHPEVLAKIQHRENFRRELGFGN